MKKRIIYIVLFTLAAIAFASYAGAPKGVTVQAFGYQAETSPKILLAILCGALALFFGVTLIFSVLKSVLLKVFYWLGFGEESAEENFNHAFIHAATGKFESAKNCLKKCRGHFKNDPRYQIISAITAPELAEITPQNRKKLSKPLYAALSYAEARDDLRRGDLTGFLKKAEDSGAAKENFDFLLETIGVCLRTGAYDKAGDMVAAFAKTPEKDRLESVLFQARAVERLKNKDPQKALDYANAAKNSERPAPIADEMIVNAYRALLRENKASRFLHAGFESKPSFTLAQLFLEAAPFETPEAQAKRIAALPATAADSEPMIALQALNFARSRDGAGVKKCLENFAPAHALYEVIRLCAQTAQSNDENARQKACDLLKTGITRLAQAEKKHSLSDKIGLFFVNLHAFDAEKTDLVEELREKANLIEKTVIKNDHFSAAPQSAARAFALNPTDRLSAIYDGEQPDD